MNFVTNFKNSQKDRYRLAIERYRGINSSIIFRISNRAFDASGDFLTSHSSLWVDAPYAINLSDFWKVFEDTKVPLDYALPKKMLVWNCPSQKQEALVVYISNSSGQCVAVNSDNRIYAWNHFSEIPKIKLPKIGRYEGVDTGHKSVKYGCKEFDLKFIKKLVRIGVREIIIDQHVVSSRQLKQIVEYFNAKQ